MTVSPSEQNRFAWLVILLLFAGSVVNYIDRAVLGVVMPQIRQDLSLTNTGYGMAVNAFLVTYMVFYILGGRVADRLGCRRAFPLTVVFWSIANMLHAFARGLASLSLFRGLLGIGEGGFYPTAIRGAAEWFPPKNRAKAVAVFLCGLSVGTLLAPPVAAWITLRWGWRAAFVATGALGFLLIPPWLLLHRRIQQIYGNRDPAPAYRAAEGPDSTLADDISLREVLARRKYWLVLASRAVTDAAWLFYLFWLPGYFQAIRGFDLKMVGRFLWIPYFCADIGALGGAWASSALIHRGMGLDRSRKSVLILSAILCVVGATAYFAADSFLALSLVSLALFGHLSWSSNIHTVITEITPPRHVAVLYGITGAAGTMLGAITQPLIGYVVDLSGYEPVFVGCGLIYILAVGLLFGAGKIERIRRLEANFEPSEVR